MTFNLIPVPPLDGATGIGLVLPEQWALKLLDFWQQPGFSLLGIVVAWNFSDKPTSAFSGVAIRACHCNAAAG